MPKDKMHPSFFKRKSPTLSRTSAITQVVLDKTLTLAKLKEYIKAFASNPTIKEIFIENNQMDDQGIALLADCLAESRQLTSLVIYSGQITDQGAKILVECLAWHPRLTVLAVFSEQISPEWDQKLQQIVQNNASASKRNQFIRMVLMLAKDYLNPASTSLLRTLPFDLILYIFSFMDFSEMGKRTDQGLGCIQFVFNYMPLINDLLKSANGFRIVEKASEKLGSSKFSLFPNLTAASKTTSQMIINHHDSKLTNNCKR